MTAVLADRWRKGAGALRSIQIQSWMLWLAAMTVIAVTGWFTIGKGMTDYLGDADDATRLLQVRDLINTGAWFDLKTMKMGGPPGMLSHWSRLIDLPLALLISLFGLVASQEASELAARIIWPLLILSPLVWLVYRNTARVHGETAGRLSLLLFIACPLGLYQFGLGRIDHHNVLIACTVSAALLMWAFPLNHKAWLWSGALSGLALAIGYEALAPVAALTAAAAVWGLADRNMAGSARRFTAALMAVFTVAFLIEFPPSLWFKIYCDAISLNMVTLTLTGGTGLLIALGPGRHWSLPQQITAIAIPGIAGVAAFGWLEPMCLAGPMGQLPAQLKPVWLDVVAETRSIVHDLIKGDIEQSLGLCTYFSVAIFAQFLIVRRQRTMAELFLFSILTFFSLFACWQYKYMGYASVVAIVPIAATISKLQGVEEVRPEIVRLGAALIMSQGAMMAGSVGLSTLFRGPQSERKAVEANAQECFKNGPIADLKVLPSGLMAAYIDIGAYIAALTEHRVLSAPYHRIADAIIANDALFKSESDALVRQILSEWRIDYVVLCRSLDDALVTDSNQGATLRGRLVNAKPPSFLKPVPLANQNSLFRVWRFEPAAERIAPN